MSASPDIDRLREAVEAVTRASDLVCRQLDAALKEEPSGAFTEDFETWARRQIEKLAALIEDGSDLHLKHADWKIRALEREQRTNDRLDDIERRISPKDAPALKRDEPVTLTDEERWERSRVVVMTYTASGDVLSMPKSAFLREAREIREEGIVEGLQRAKGHLCAGVGSISPAWEKIAASIDGEVSQRRASKGGGA